MKTLIALALFAVTAGCATLTESQRKTFRDVVIASVVLSAAGAIQHGGGPGDRHISTPGDPCAKLGPEACR